MELKKDPFDEFDFTDQNFSAFQAPISYRGKRFSFFRVPYFGIDDQINAKKRIIEAYSYREMLMLHGYSGCGKSTIMNQLRNKDPQNFLLVPAVSKLTPSKMLCEMMAVLDGRPYLGRPTLKTLVSRLEDKPRVMFLLDEIGADTPQDRIKLDYLRQLHDMTETPMVLANVNYVYSYIMAENRDKYFCSLKTRLRDQAMEGMTVTDVLQFLKYLSEKENLEFSYVATQALVDTCLNQKIGGIYAFVTILGKCITSARVSYYMDGKKKIPSDALYLKPENPEGERIYGERETIELSKTPVPVTIDEYLVAVQQQHYRSDFPKKRR